MSQTKEQRKEAIYEFIVAFYLEQGVMPTIREIQEALGIKSTSTIHYDIKELSFEGRIIKPDNSKSRSIKIGKLNRNTAKEMCNAIENYCMTIDCKDCPTNCLFDLLRDIEKEVRDA